MTSAAGETGSGENRAGGADDALGAAGMLTLAGIAGCGSMGPQHRWAAVVNRTAHRIKGTV